MENVLRHRNHPKSLCFGRKSPIPRCSIDDTGMEEEECWHMDIDNLDSFKPPEISNHQTTSGFDIIFHPHAPDTEEGGMSFMDRYDQDVHASKREAFPYFPFATRKEWELAYFLSNSEWSSKKIDQFLKLEIVSMFIGIISQQITYTACQIEDLQLSFGTAKDLKSRIEHLPRGPEWKCEEIETQYEVDHPMKLYYRNPLECMEAFIQDPLLYDHISWSPYRLYYANDDTSEDPDEIKTRIYTEWLSGDHAWQMQVSYSFASD